MAGKNFYYGIKINPKFGVAQAEKISFDDLGKSEYDYQVILEQLYSYDGNGEYYLSFIKDGQRVDNFEIGGWKFREFVCFCNWKASTLWAYVTDSNNETRKRALASGKGAPSKDRPTMEELLQMAFEEILRISEFSTISMLELCDPNQINMTPCTLSNYNDMLKCLLEYSEKVEEIRNRLHNNPENKDMATYNKVIKPRLIEYMEKLSNVKISQEMLDPK